MLDEYQNVMVENKLTGCRKEARMLEVQMQGYVLTMAQNVAQLYRKRY